MPYEDAGACPFEGCVYREWQARDRVPVFAERRDNACEVFVIAPGERVTALTGVVAVIFFSFWNCSAARRSQV